MAIYGNGANLTSLPSSAPTSSQVGTATASLGAGVVGSYALCQYEPDGVGINAGDTTSGNNLRYAAASGNRNNAPGGTWRAMGSMPASSTPEVKTSVWLRIS